MPVRRFQLNVATTPSGLTNLQDVDLPVGGRGISYSQNIINTQQELQEPFYL